jgi:nitroreductase
VTSAADRALTEEPAIDPTALAALLAGRRSIRAFGPDPLPQALLVELFAAAQHAPSWCNIQPWRVVVTAPPLTAALGDDVLAAYEAGERGPEIPFPPEYPAPYLAHRRACAGSLYQAMGIVRGDDAGRDDAWRRNYRFFGAPHVAVVSVDRRLGAYALIDVGIWLGYLLAQAEALGIATCPMASLAAYPGPLRRRLPLGEHESIALGIALGYADGAAPANRCQTPRDPIDANVMFAGGW